MDDIIWQDFVETVREAGSHRNRIKTLDSDMGDYLDTGPQKKGGYPNKRARFKGRKFNDTSAPGPAPGGLEEEVSPESFEIHETLVPELWDGLSLKPQIAERLMKIAQNFIKGFPVKINIQDVRLTGSLANYNWSNYSDVDLHIVVDFLDVDENTDLVKSLFDNARMRWNNKHRITMKGYDVEIYVENAGEEHVSSGIYSVMGNAWIEEPTQKSTTIDFATARQKAQDIEFQINIISNLITARKFKTAIKNIDRLKQKIKNMRRAGLEGPQQEFSIENIAFKILRRDGMLDFLEELKVRAYDEAMTIKEE
jgi:predicted nucleotidyltransferase